MKLFVDTYIQTLHESLDADGIYPMPVMLRAGKQITIVSFACPPETMLRAIKARIPADNLTEVLFGLDSYCQDGQGTTLDSAVIVFHLQRATEPRLGVLEYSWNSGDPIFKPVNWKNAWWSLAYGPLLTEFDEIINRREL